MGMANSFPLAPPTMQSAGTLRLSLDHCRCLPPGQYAEVCVFVSFDGGRWGG
jgi:hypothetical protein